MQWIEKNNTITTYNEDSTQLILFWIDGFVYGIYLENNKLFALKKIAQQVATTSDLNQLLNDILNENKYKKVHFISTSFDQTLVPDDIYTPGQGAEYLNLVTNLDNATIVFKDNVATQHATLLYRCPTGLPQIGERSGGAFQLHHFLKPIIDYTNKQANEYEKVVYITVLNKELWVVAYKNGVLQLANAFESKTIEDEMYYISNVYRQLGFHPHRDQLISIEKRSTEWESLFNAYFTYEYYSDTELQVDTEMVLTVQERKIMLPVLIAAECVL